MRIRKHDIRRTLVAWLLLTLFMVPMVTRAVHVCHLQHVAAADNAKASAHHTDGCAICCFALLTFDRAESIVLGALTAVAVCVSAFFMAERKTFVHLATASLRAPPGMP